MALRTDDCQTSGGFYFWSQFDVRTTTRHVGCDCHHGFLSGACHDFSLFLVQLGVEHVVRDAAQLEHAAQQLGDFHRCCSDQHRASSFYHFLNFVDYGVVFLFLCLVYAVVHVDASHRTVGRDGHDVEFVDVPELACLSLCGTSHTGKLVIHAEVVLQGDCCEGLCRGFHFHALFRLDGLVQTVAVAAAFHDTSCLLVDNFDFSVVDDVFDVAVKESIGLEQLVDSVHAFSLDGIVLCIL